MSNRAGFTMVELVLVVVILAILAGMAVVVYGGVGAATDEQAIQAECATVRSACLRFQADVGQPPHLIAELLQRPDTWWWKAGADRPPLWEAAIRRGWNGPYLVAERGSDDVTSAADPVTATEEARLLSGGGYERRQSSAGNLLKILTSEYASHPQDATLDDPANPDSTRRRRSHFQLEESAQDGLVVRFVHDPAADPPGRCVHRLPTGLRP